MTKDKQRIIKQIYIISIMVMLCCFGYSEALQTNYQTNSEKYLIALKNDKVFALEYSQTIAVDSSEQQTVNLIWIRNDQQSVTLGVPVLRPTDSKQHQISNLTKTLPLWSNLLNSKGYLKPSNPFQSHSSQFIKGYKYTKPAYHDSTIHQTYEEIQAFIKTVIQMNGLVDLNLRMEDTFTLRLKVVEENSSNIKNFKLNGFNVRYLFATVGKELVPGWIKEKVGTNVVGYEKYLEQEKANVLERRLYGKGLHQWINHTVTLDDLTDIQLQSIGLSCFLEFTDILPESTYIDSDQRRKQTINYETINIQKPTFASKQYFYKYRVSWTELKETGVRKYTYHQPVHFRYPVPSMLNYTKVYLHPIDEVRIVCEAEDHDQVDKLGPRVFKVEENLLFERGTASIPNADISKAKIVSTVTLVVCLVAALVIIRQLK